MERGLLWCWIYQANDTLGVYLSLLSDALEYSPDSCWLEIAHIAVRIPVMLAMLAGDDASLFEQTTYGTK
jgi:hypothetical protein